MSHVTINNKYYIMLHGRCALCDTSLDGVPFLHKDNSLNCVGCFTK